MTIFGALLIVFDRVGNVPGSKVKERPTICGNALGYYLFSYYLAFLLVKYPF